MILHPLTATLRLPYIPVHCDQNRYSSSHCMQKKTVFLLTERVGIEQEAISLCFKMDLEMLAISRKAAFYLLLCQTSQNYCLAMHWPHTKQLVHCHCLD